MKSLCTRHRRVIRIHLARDVEAGLRRILQVVEEALSGSLRDDQGRS